MERFWEAVKICFNALFRFVLFVAYLIGFIFGWFYGLGCRLVKLYSTWRRDNQKLGRRSMEYWKSKEGELK